MSLRIQYFLFILSIILMNAGTSQAQLFSNRKGYSRADSLRGTLTPLRTCYDIKYYHLDIKVDVERKFITGSNFFKFRSTQDFNQLQFDLFSNLKVEKVVYKGRELPFTREANAVFVRFPQVIKEGAVDEFRVYYSGTPVIAKNAPWDGGVVFAKDSKGKPWVASACQGIGASSWWPNKDHQSDEVDSMLISVSVPDGLKNVSNGRLRKVTKEKGAYSRFDWFVSNPINNYCVAINIADYVHFSDNYDGENGKLSLDYWVLPQDIDKAKKQFDNDVKRMLKAFEHWFGPYPFYEDGFKLVSTPYLGMEHQSAVAYGNGYMNGYRGRDLSGSGWGLKFDFIIVHESGHEWFGNNITSKDVADMWIHESFTNYSESLFIDYHYGKQAGQEYLHGTRKGILNEMPIVGDYDVNQSGSGDMYPKGGNMLNMVRVILNDDNKWRSILRGLNSTFYHRTVTYRDIVDYISKESGRDFSKVFDQYLKYTNIPTLNLQFSEGKVFCRWIADVPAFDMPVRIRIKGGEFKFVTPTVGRLTPVEIPGINRKNIEVDTFNYYIGILED